MGGIGRHDGLTELLALPTRQQLLGLRRGFEPPDRWSARLQLFPLPEPQGPPLRPIIGWDGRVIRETPAWIATPDAAAFYVRIAGATAHTAKERMVEILGETGHIDGDPRPITHPVKFFEKGDKPLEIVTTRQWYITNGGRDGELREKLLARGRELIWHPDHMKVRYENWVEGLNGDWLISRQRFFGVPLPLWYRLDADANPVYDGPLIPSDDRLPIDPSSDVPDGFTEDQRGQPGGFIGDPDVMDTWATSSLSPQIAGGWERDPDLWSRVYPMDVRPMDGRLCLIRVFGRLVSGVSVLLGVGRCRSCCCCCCCRCVRFIFTVTVVTVFTDMLLLLFW